MLLTVPYCTTAEFIEWPTFLDTFDLRSGDLQPQDQTATLNKLLLTGSAWCDNYVEMGAEGTLTAHVRTENKRIRPDRGGRLLWHPDHIPFISLQSLAYGSRLGSLTTYTSPPTFPEDGRSVVIDLQGGTSAWSGSLQFGAPMTGQQYATMTYQAGFPNTLLASNVTSGAMSLPLLDVLGIQPGQTLRVYDPGADENVTVNAGWTPTSGPASLPLVSGLLNAHTATTPVRVSAMGSDTFEACANYTIAMLMRPDSTAEDAFPDMKGGISTRLSDSRKDGSGLVFEAQHLLEPYRRVF